MERLFYGILSSNMVAREKTIILQHIPTCSVNDLILSQWSLILISLQCPKECSSTSTSSISSNGIHHSVVHTLKGKDISIKQIKNVLINEKAMTLNDLEAIQRLEIPKGPFFNRIIKINAQNVAFSLFPSFTPILSIMDRMTMTEKIMDDDKVIWCILSKRDDQDKESVSNKFFLCPRKVTYQQFLIHFCKQELRINHSDNNNNKNTFLQIEYELFIFVNPVIFGKATCSFLDKTKSANRSVYTFFFSRELSCLDAYHCCY